MTSIIDGKRYNTETATFLSAWENQYFSGDLFYEREELYQTKKGSYFLYCEGGAGSVYSEPSDGNWNRPGEMIKHISREEAYKWCESRHRTKAIEKYFSDMIVEA